MTEPVPKVSDSDTLEQTAIDASDSLQQTAIDAFEAIMPFDGSITVSMPMPLKLALIAICNRTQLSISDLVRMALQKYLPDLFPDFQSIYRQKIAEQMARLAAQQRGKQ